MFQVPGRITVNVRHLCRLLKTGTEPCFLPVKPRRDSVINECFEDVGREIAERGGSMQFGWLMWEWAGLVIEAEFHAVWKSAEGELVDVSAKRDGEKMVLFVPDPVRRFEGRRIGCVRVAIGRDPRIVKWISLKEEFERKVAKEMEDRYGEDVTLSLETAALNSRIQALAMELATCRDGRRAG